MKIKLSIVEKDRNYLGRILDSFVEKYADKVEVYAYSSLEQMKGAQNIADIYLISDEFQFEEGDIPAKSCAVYFVESKEIGSLRGAKAIAKYQRLDDIYRQVLDLYSEVSGIVVKESNSNGNMDVIVFTSAQGGSGKTTMAVSAAYNLAMRGRSVLYLSLEDFGNTDLYFDRSTIGDLGSVIYAIKSKKSNISIKLENVINQNFAGVSYISSPENAYDVSSVSSEDVETIINEVAALNKYQAIILDTDLPNSEKMQDILSLATKIIYVAEVNEGAKYKLDGFSKAIHQYEHKKSKNVSGKIHIIANKSKMNAFLADYNGEYPYVGNIDIFNMMDRQKVEIIAKTGVFENVL